MRQKRLGKKIATWFLCLSMVLTTVNLPAFTTEVKAAEIGVSTYDELRDALASSDTGTTSIVLNCDITRNDKLSDNRLEVNYGRKIVDMNGYSIRSVSKSSDSSFIFVGSDGSLQIKNSSPKKVVIDSLNTGSYMPAIKTAKYSELILGCEENTNPIEFSCKSTEYFGWQCPVVNGDFTIYDGVTLDNDCTSLNGKYGNFKIYGGVFPCGMDLSEAGSVELKKATVLNHTTSSIFYIEVPMRLHYHVYVNGKELTYEEISKYWDGQATRLGGYDFEKGTIVEVIDPTEISSKKIVGNIVTGDRLNSNGPLRTENNVGLLDTTFYYSKNGQLLKNGTTATYGNYDCTVVFYAAKGYYFTKYATIEYDGKIYKSDDVSKDGETAWFTIPNINVECSHSSSSWLHDGDKHWKMCSVCRGKYVESTHSFEESISGKTITYTCTECGFTKSSQIPETRTKAYRSVINLGVALVGDEIPTTAKVDCAYISSLDSTKYYDFADVESVTYSQSGTFKNEKTTVTVVLKAKNNFYFASPVIASAEYQYTRESCIASADGTTLTVVFSFTPYTPADITVTLPEFTAGKTYADIAVATQIKVNDVDAKDYYVSIRKAGESSWTYGSVSEGVVSGKDMSATVIEPNTEYEYSVNSDINKAYGKSLTITNPSVSVVTDSFCGEAGCRFELNYISTDGHNYDSGTITKQVTCTEDGEITFACTDPGCTETKSMVIPTTGHSAMDVPQIVPTCADEGKEAGQICSKCNTVLSGRATISATGIHTFEWVIDKPATTTETGLKHEECSVCKYAKEAVTIEKLPEEHVHVGEKVDQVDATCIAYGVKAYYQCTCGNCFTDSACTNQITDLATWKTGDGKIEMKTHSYTVEKTAKVDATCTTDGKTAVMKCATCDATQGGEIIAKLGHDYKVTDNVASSETVAGYTEYTCTRCSDSYKDAKPLADHVHDWVEDAEVPATCVTDGVAAGKHCSKCSETEGYTVIPTTGTHSYTVEKTAKVPATCTTDGTEAVMKCAGCDTTIGGEKIPAAGHDMTKVVSAKVPATCEKDGKEEVIGCKNCDHTEGGAVIKAIGHKWDAGTVTKEATETAEGVKTYKCTNAGCSETKTESIPKKEATKPDDKKPDDQKPTSPKKGDALKDDKTGIQVKVLDPDKKEVVFVAPKDATAKTITVPATVTVNGVTYKVTKINDGAFKGNKTVTKIVLPSSIVSIGKDAFNGCKKLKTITIPKNVTEIGTNAFKGCVALTKITIPSKVVKIGANAFNGCKKLKNITVKTKKLTTKTVGKNAFKGVPKKATMKVPKKQLKAYKKFMSKKGFKGKVKA